MRNIFDQYSQPENQLTHALASTLHADHRLIHPFLKWLGIRDLPAIHEIQLAQQQLPGEIVTEVDDEGAGLPDICLWTESGWACLFESKVQAAASVSQLKRHVATAKRRQFNPIRVVLLSVDARPRDMPTGSIHREWREVYSWFRRQIQRSPWAKIFTDYMERFESRMLANEYSIRGTITMFDGLKFDDDNQYTYREAKRLIRLLCDDLQQRKKLHAIGVDPQGNRRGAITGRDGEGVWDFLPLEVGALASNFTAHPHLTIEITRQYTAASITVPNGVKGGIRTKLKSVGQERFFDLLRDVERKTRGIIKSSKGSGVHAYALQRHFANQRSSGTWNASVQADLRTIVPGKRSQAKYQPQWVEAIYQALVNKRSNIQMGLSTRFSYACPRIRSRHAADLFESAWLAMSPMLSFVIDEDH